MKVVLWGKNLELQFTRDVLLCFEKGKNLQYFCCQKVPKVTSSKRRLGWIRCVHRRGFSGQAKASFLQVSLDLLLPLRNQSQFPHALCGDRFSVIAQSKFTTCTRTRIIPSYCQSVELQFGFPFPLWPIIQSSSFDPVAMFSHISECSL